MGKLIFRILPLFLLAIVATGPAAAQRRIDSEASRATEAKAAVSSARPRKIAELEASLVTRTSVCRNGQNVAFIAEVEGIDQVFVGDLRTGQKRQLTSGSGPDEAGDSAIISPDCGWIAYDSGRPGSPELRLVATDGSKPKTFFRGGSLLQLQPDGWSSDGKYVLIDLVREDLRYQIGRVSVADGSVRILATRALKTLNGRKPWSRPMLSPDGRYVAYEYPPQADARQRRILLLSTRESRERVLVRDARSYCLLGWSPDGKSVLYASVRDGSWNAWAVEVGDSAANVSHRQFAADLGNISQAVGFTPEGSFYYVAPTASNDLYLARLDAGETRLGTPEKLASRLADESSPAWSPDGRRLAYAYGSGHRLDPFKIALRSASTGDERQHALATLVRFGGHRFQPQWSPDGRSLLAVGRDSGYNGPGRDSQGIYRIDLASGRTEPIVRTKRICWWDCVEWATWAPDGRILYVRWRPSPPHIVALDPTTGLEGEIYRLPSAAEISRLAVSPDGKELAFVLRDGAQSALKVVPTRGGRVHGLVTATMPVTISWPAWTPDSRQIIYATETTGAEGRVEFWRVSTQKGKPQNRGLSMPGVRCEGLSVHPDGRRIAFTAGARMRSAILVLKDFMPGARAAQ